MSFFHRSSSQQYSISFCNRNSLHLTQHISSSSKATFISEFTSLLEDFISSSSELIFTGDFNFHVDDPSAPNVSTFLDLLDTFNLAQHITFPTHNYGHTLDLLITRSTSSLISATDHTYTPISDHRFISSTLSIPTNSRSPRITKLTRPINSVNITDFSNFSNFSNFSKIFHPCIYSLHISCCNTRSLPRPVYFYPLHSS